MNACVGGWLGKGNSFKRKGLGRLWLTSLIAAVVPVLSCSQDGLQQELRDAAVGQIDLDQLEQNITSYPPLQVFIRDEALHEPNRSQPRIYVKNTSATASIANFRVHYYFTVENGRTPQLQVYYAPRSQVKVERATGNLWRVVYDYAGATLGPGQSMPDTSGSVVGLSYGNATGWNEINDWSAFGVTGTFKQTTRVVVVASDGTLVAGQLPPELPTGGTGSTNTTGSGTNSGTSTASSSSSSTSSTATSTATSSNATNTSTTAATSTTTATSSTTTTTTSSSMASSSSTSSSSSGGTTTTGPTSPQTVTFRIKLPHQLTREEVALGTTGGNLTLSDGVHVFGAENASAFASISAVDGGAISRIGVAAEALDVYGQVSVTLADNAKVWGDLVGGTLSIAPTVDVDGTTTSGANMNPLRVIEWDVTFPATAPTSMLMQPGEVRTITPGNYGLTKVERTSRLKLSAGTYTFEKLMGEPDSIIDIDNSNGPVFIYARTDFTLRGVQLLHEDVANTLLGAAGTTRSGVEREWRGVVVVPNGHLELPTLHNDEVYTGSFFAKQLTVHAHTDVYHEAFSPENFCSTGAACSSFCPCDEGQECSASEVAPCNDGLTCIEGNGSRFGLPTGTSVCVPEACATVPQGEGCGECPRDCSDVSCGGDLADGCGGVCPGVCEEGHTMCRSDSDCRAGLACLVTGDGVPTCVESECSFPEFAAQHCGAGAVCGACRECVPDCDGRACSSDGCGGTCPCAESSFLRAPTGLDNTQAFRDAVTDFSAPPAPADDDPTAGGLTGSFVVTDQGAAQYTIPLAVPPGIHGMQPALGLQYNSIKRIGALGMGWALTGLSRITRCNRTVGHDTYAAPVNLNADDAYCLDEKRLFRRKNSDGTYGAEAYTDVETFSRIRFVGDSAIGPKSIEVETKDGRKLTYGAITYQHRSADPEFGTPQIVTIEADDAIALTRGVRRVWALSKIEDRWGNFMVIRYGDHVDANVQNTVIELEPLVVMYGMQDDLVNVLAQSVVFDYGEEWAGKTSYVAGGHSTNKRLLTGIRMLTGGQTVREYEIKYRNDASTRGNPWVRSVSVCAGEAAARACLAPVTFGYEYPPDPELALMPEVYDVPCSNGQCPRLIQHIADLDADGDDDIIALGKTLISTPQHSKQWSFDMFSTPENFSQYHPTLDLDGDGRDEVVTSNEIMRWDGAQFVPEQHPYSDRLKGFPSAPVGDFDGDGRKDWLFTSGNSFEELWVVRDTYGSELVENWRCSGSSQKVADFDGDGQDELLCMGLKILFNVTSEPRAVTIAGGGSESSLLDWNGDGLPDMQTGGGLWVNDGALGTATYQVVPTLVDGLDGKEVVVDIDGDGRDELFSPTSGKLFRSVGEQMGVEVTTLAPWPEPERPWRAGGMNKGDLDGDGDLEIFRLERDRSEGPANAARLLIASLPTSKAGLLTTITDGLRNRTEISYDFVRYSQSDGSSYERTQTEPDPGTRLLNKVPGLVTSVKTSQRDVANGTARSGQEQHYKYRNAQIGPTGAWFGFESRTVRTAAPVERKVSFEYHNDKYWRAGRVKRIVIDGIDGNDQGGQDTFSRSEEVKFNWVEKVSPYSGRLYPWLQQTERSLLDEKQLIGREVTDLTSDDWGNLAARTSRRLAADETEISRTQWGAIYPVDTDQWLLSNRAIETFAASKGGETKGWRLEFKYKEGTTDVEDVLLNPDGEGGFYLKQHNVYDPRNGNNIRTEYHNSQGLMRASDTFYDDVGLFPSSMRFSDVDRRHQEQMAFDPGTGQIIANMDANGRLTRFFYDVHGRIQHVVTPLETVSVSRRSVKTHLDPWLSPGVLQVTELSSKGQELATIFDGRGGALRSYDRTSGVAVLRRFDGLGRLELESEPTSTFEPSAFTSYTYDELDRVETAETYDGRITYFDYSTQAQHDEYLADVFSDSEAWFGTTVTAPDGSMHVYIDGPASTILTAQVSAAGASMSELPPNGPNAARTRFTFGAMDHLKEVVDADGEITAMVFDAFGRRESVTNGTRGQSVTTYNELGDVVSTLDANQDLLCNRYDSLGRMTALVKGLLDDGCPETGGEVLERFEYDDGAGMIGQLALAQARHNPDLSEDWITSRYSVHEATGQLASESLELPGLPQALTTAFTYDGPFLKTVSYPSVGSGVAPVVSYDYFPNGTTRRASNAANGNPYWEVTEQKLASLPTQELFGNGVVQGSVYNDIGADTPNCNGEVDGACEFNSLRRVTVTPTSGGSAHEEYLYDKLGRLSGRTSKKPNATGVSATLRYDGLGRLDRYSPNNGDATTYSYTTGGDMLSVVKAGSTKTYEYANSSRKHMLTDLDGESFSYDANGNQTQGPLASGAVQTREFNHLDMPWKLTTGSDSTYLEYDASGTRVMKQTPTRTKLYASGLWECEGETPEKASGDDGTFECESQTFKVFASGKLVAQIQRSEEGDDLSYIHSDRLGSVWQVTDEDGEIIESREYEAFGETVAPFDIAQITAGYTSHEHDADVELINMRGRLYDPNQRRFVSPDPIVASPMHAQSWNPFSYVMNDPFNAVDPSGYSGVEPAPSITVISGSMGGGSPSFGGAAPGSRPDGPPSGAPSPTQPTSTAAPSSEANAAGSATVQAASGEYVGGAVNIQGAGAMNQPNPEVATGPVSNAPPSSGQAAGTSMTGGAASGVGGTGAASNSFGAALDSGVGGISFGWAQVGSIALDIGLSFIPFAGAVRAAASGDIKGALIEAAIDIATGGTAGPAKAAAKGARLIAGAIDAARAAKAARGGAQNIANGARLARQLAGEEAASIFTKSGALRADVIAGSRVAVPGSKLGNQGLAQRLTADGSNIADWAKMTTETFKSPSGPFQVHFYQNLRTGAVHYADDFKAVFNHNGVWP